MRSKNQFSLLAIFVFLTAILVTPSFASPVNTTTKSIEFLIDTSGSMRGAKLVSVKNAFNTIIDSLPDNFKAEVITFSTSANILVPYTNDKKILKFSVNNIQARGETALYDAIKLSLNNKNLDLNSRVIVITDGEDTVSAINLNQVLLAASENSTPIDIIGLQTNPKQSATLTQLTSQNDGNFYSLDSLDQMIEAYKASLNSIFTTTPNPSAVPEIDTNGKGQDKYNLTPIYLSALTFICILSLILLTRKIILRRKSKFNRVYLLERYEQRRLRSVETLKEARSFDYEKLPRFLRNWISKKLDLIHSDMSLQRVTNILIAVFSIFFILFLIISSNFLVSLIFSILATPLLFNSYVSSQRQKHLRLFADELPDFLNMLASALRSGLTLSQGLEAFTLENNGEVARQIRRASSEIQMGSTIEDALMDIAIRMENEDLKWTVTALSIQRNVGGSFASILNTTYTTVKERSEIRREIRTLSAEGKLSAYILMALPIGIFFFLFLTKRDYVSIFWTKIEGLVLLSFIGGSLAVGWLWIKKIIEIKI